MSAYLVGFFYLVTFECIVLHYLTKSIKPNEIEKRKRSQKKCIYIIYIVLINDGLWNLASGVPSSVHFCVRIPQLCHQLFPLRLDTHRAMLTPPPLPFCYPCYSAYTLLPPPYVGVQGPICYFLSLLEPYNWETVAATAPNHWWIGSPMFNYCIRAIYRFLFFCV